MIEPVYDVDGIAVYHGDCRQIVPSLRGLFQAIVTDPPYGNGFAARPTKWQRRDAVKPATWDDEAPSLEWLLPFAATVLVWGGNHFRLPPSRSWLAWVKPDAPPSMGNVELAWTNADRPSRAMVHTIRSTTANGERGKGHPTPKPLAVMRWSIEHLRLATGTVILDPYMGGGSTLVAARKAGFPAIGIEIDPRYVKAAARRLRACETPLFR